MVYRSHPRNLNVAIRCAPFVWALGCNPPSANEEPGSSSGSSADTPTGPSGFSVPKPQQHIIAGFDVTITKPGDGTVLLSWPDQGVAEYEVWTSDDPYFTPEDAGATRISTTSARTYVAPLTTEAYYRIRAPGADTALSTTVGQLSYELWSGYTKLGWCLVSTIDTWPELQSDMASNPSTASMWNAAQQAWSVTDLAFEP